MNLILTRGLRCLIWNCSESEGKTTITRNSVSCHIYSADTKSLWSMHSRSLYTQRSFSYYDLNNNFHEGTLNTKRNPHFLQLNFNKNFNYMEPWIFPVTLIFNFVLSIKGIKVNFFTNKLWRTQIKIKEWTGNMLQILCIYIIIQHNL